MQEFFRRVKALQYRHQLYCMHLVYYRRLFRLRSLGRTAAVFLILHHFAIRANIGENVLDPEAMVQLLSLKHLRPNRPKMIQVV